MIRDIRVATRAVLRKPGIATVSVLALGLGVGLPSALFSVARGMALRGLPVEDGRAIMHLERRPVGRTGEGWGALPRDFLAWREQQRSFEGLAGVDFRSVALRVGPSTDRRSAAALSANAFDLLRVHAQLGRTFQEGDDAPGAEPVVILGQRVWRDRMAGDPDAIGQTLFIDGRAHSVIGVMPEGFEFPISEELWVPLVIPPGAAADPAQPAIDVFGRLADGVSRSEAGADFALIAARLAQQYPETNENMEVMVKPYTERHMGETAMATLWVMLAAVMLVLIVACVNVANLLLVRAVHRMRDLAVRAALGASRRAILAQLLMESMVLAAAGGALGVLIAMGASEAMGRWVITDRLPYWSDIRLDGATLLYALGISLAAGLFAGVLPAVKAMGADVITTLKDEARGSSGLRIGRIMHGLVVLQIAFSLGLLVVTGLMAASVRNVKDVRFGFQPQNTITAQITLPESLDAEGRARFQAGLESRLRDDPGIQAFAVASSLPATRATRYRFALDGREYADIDEMPSVRRVAVSADFFATFGAGIARGRGFDTRDAAAGAPVAIVNERFAATVLAGQEAIGHQIRFGNADEPWRTIVGVVPDLWVGGLDASGDRNPAGVYVPLAQAPPLTFSVAAVARADGAAVARAIREATSAIDPDVPVYEVRTMAQVITDNSWFYGMGLVIVAACGITALVLAAIGLYGVIAFSVGRRTREFGIRMAVGANPGSIVRLVLSRGALQVTIGLALGFALAWALARGIASLLFNVSPSDPMTFITFGAFLVFVTFAASLIPALRAARVDPLAALRAD